MNANPSEAPAARGDATREALLSAAMDAFGSDGFDKVSLRALAERANVNQALIAYHFGSKAGLYHAVFLAMADRIRARLAPVMATVEAELALAGTPPTDRRHLFGLMDALLALMTGADSEIWAQLIIREQQKPTEAFDILYKGFMERFVGLVVRLIDRIRGRHDDHDARLLALTLIGQIVMFRVARAGVLRVMAWSELDSEAVEAIRTRLHANLAALLEGPAP